MHDGFAQRMEPAAAAPDVAAVGAAAPPAPPEPRTARSLLDLKALAMVGSSAPGEYAVDAAPSMSARLRTELEKSSNFHKSAKWSPDGTCLLTTSEDCIARLLELPMALDTPITMRCAVRANEGETIYDSCWYPSMDSTKPETCLFATCARGHPVHLWDAFTGRLAASYTALNAVAELDTAMAVAFSNDGSALYATYAHRLCAFITARPGAEPHSLPMKTVLPGMLSCVAVAPPTMSHDVLLAIGTYGGRVGLFSQHGSLNASLAAQSPGVTQVAFSQDGAHLYAGGRKSDKILAWDIRKLDAPLFSFHRPLSTQQRITFALHPTVGALLTGDEEGRLRCYDTATGELSGSLSAHHSTSVLAMSALCSQRLACINSVAIHPWYPLIAMGTGTRRFDISDDEDEDNAAAASMDAVKQDKKRRQELRKQEERIQLWRTG